MCILITVDAIIDPARNNSAVLAVLRIINDIIIDADIL